MTKTRPILWALTMTFVVIRSNLSGQEFSIVKSGKQNARTVEAVRATKPPTVDGKIDDECWKTARPITDYLSIDSERRATHQSIGYLCYDDSHLFIAMKCLLPPGIVPGVERGSQKKKPHDTYIFSDDIVEVMLDPGRTGEDYYQLAVNAYNSTYDSARRGGGTRNDPSWNGDWTSGTYITDGYWSVEISMPFHSLGISPGTKPVWGINLCREVKVPQDEYSSIAVRGTFNSAKSFAKLEGLKVDFSRYLFQIGPPIVWLESANAGPRAILTVPVKNATGHSRRVEVQRRYIGADQREATESKTITLEAGQSMTLFSENPDIERLVPSRTDAYLIKTPARTKQVVVYDASDQTILALSHIQRPWFFEPIKIVVADPWQRRMTEEKLAKVSLEIELLLPPEQRETSELVVALISRETGKPGASQSFGKPAEKLKVAFDAEKLSWGAYDAEAALRDSNGRTTVLSRALATILPGGKHRIKVLNNMVSELANARERGSLDEKEIAFMNPRDGWVYFSASGNAQLRLNSQSESLLVSRRDGGEMEAMRYLPVGRHLLRVDGKPEQVIVRAVPELVYSCHPSGYSWDFVKKEVAPHSNMLLGGTNEPAAMNEWKSAGKKWFTFAVAPGHGLGGVGMVPAERYYELLSTHEGFTNPLVSGVMVDQIGASSVEQKIEFARTLSKIVSGAKFTGKEYRPWYEGTVFGSEGDNAFMKIVLQAGWPFSYYYYLTEKPTESDAVADIQDKILGIGRGGEQQIPGSLRRAIVTLGYWSDWTKGQVLDIDPSVNFKVLMQLQMKELANDPSFFGLYGFFWYYSPYVDEETLRWTSQLHRYYGIEGKTGDCTTDSYRLNHLVNPDFEESTKGWTIKEAESGTVTVKTLSGYGNLQGRFVGGSRGDNFLTTRRSAKGPNSFSQSIKNLTPGRVYSLKMITSDYGNLKSEKSVEQKNGVTIRLDNVDLVSLPDKNQQTTFPSHYGHVLGKFNANYPHYLNYHWYVFRARGTSAHLTISDWADKSNAPSDGIGQETMYNFIEIEPYFEQTASR